MKHYKDFVIFQSYYRKEEYGDIIRKRSRRRD